MSQISRLARKRAIDSLQEELRAEKDEWNGETSEFISALISLKKGINGRGDKNKGLPPSKITEEFSGQVSSFLSETAHKGSRVFELANKIIGDQNQYASHKKNALEEFEMRLVASEKNSLLKEASWFGSVFYNKLKNHRKLDEIDRALRQRLLESCGKFKSSFKNFEGQILDDDNPIGIPMAISSLTTTLFTMVADLIPTFLKLKKFRVNKKDELGEKKPLISTPSKDKESLPSTILSEDQIKSIALMQEQFVSIGVIVAHLKSILKDDKLKQLESIYDDFSKKLSTLLILKDKDPAEKDKVQSLFSETTDLATKLFLIFEESLGKEESLDKYLEKIKPTTATKTSVEKEQKLLLKEASNAVSRWLDKKVLSLKKSPFAKIKLDVVNQSLEVRKAIDEFMDLIEKQEIWPEELAEKFELIVGHSAILAQRIELLANIYNSEERRNIRPKNFYVQNITVADLRKLREAKSKLEAYKSFFGEEDE